MNRLSKGKILAGGLGVNGDVRVSGELSAKRSATTIADGASMVATAAIIQTGTIASATPTTGRNVTTGTAAAIIALASGYAVGDTTEFTLINLAATTHALTLIGGTDVSIVGSATVSAASSATWYVRIASATTVVLYRK
jgi:hypothetical protein